jgi:hypothetical protein
VVYVSAMGAIKPLHLVLFSVCCLLPLAASVVVGVGAARRARRRR